MKFDAKDFEQTCLLKDGKAATIIQINADAQPFDVAVQVPGEPEPRYIAWENFERVNGAIVEVAT